MSSRFRYFSPDERVILSKGLEAYSAALRSSSVVFSQTEYDFKGEEQRVKKLIRELYSARGRVIEVQHKPEDDA